MVLKIVVLLFATVLAFWISAISGGGASLILIPLLNWLLPISTAPFALTLGTFSSSASRIFVFRKNVKWTIVFWFVPFAVPAVALGAWLIKFVNPLYLQFFVGLFLLANVKELLKKKSNDEPQIKPSSKLTIIVVGMCAGLVSGITGAIGLLFNRFYLRNGFTKEEIIATRAANEISLHAIKLIIYVALGLFSMPALWLGLAIALGAFVASFTLKPLLAFISELVFKKIGYAAMVVSGLYLVVSTITGVIQQDQISFTKNQYAESTINWRNSQFVLEFAFDDGLEIETAITETELPAHLQKKYSFLVSQYDKVLLEKVYHLGAAATYEFYCFKSGVLTKLEYNER